MATNEVPRGPISGYVVDNIKRLRAERRWSLAELSERLKVVGRPMLTSGVHRLEQGRRRIDVDDVVALAAAFDVAPVTLLLPPTTDGEIQLTDDISVNAARAWRWMIGRRPLVITDEDDSDYAIATFLRNALPKGIRQYPPGAAGRELFLQDHPDTKVTSVAEIKARQEARDGER